MSREAILIIKDAESRAKEICAAAAEQAAGMIAKSEEEGKALLREAERASAEDRKRSLAEAQRKADDILSEGKKSAEDAANALRRHTNNHYQNAIRILLWGISEKCQ